VNRYILIIREDITVLKSPDELAEVISLHKQWAMELARKGYFIEGHGIDEQGQTVMMNEDGDVVVEEIYFPEVAFGGFYIIQADSLETAIEIAHQCPTLAYGDKIEVRPLI